jgi:hypothetical protein
MSNPILSSYRLGDLVILSNLTEYEKEKLCLEHPNSFGDEYIKLNLPNTIFTNKIENKIKNITSIVSNFINNNDLFPSDIEDSIVIHIRLGDVLAGLNNCETSKRPLDIDFLQSIIDSIKEPYKNIYIIGKSHYGSSSFDIDKYDECKLLSDKYLNDCLARFNAIHFNSNNPDIDLCCAIKSKLFIQGKGNYSKLILEIRKHLNLNSIETNYDIYY